MIKFKFSQFLPGFNSDLSLGDLGGLFGGGGGGGDSASSGTGSGTVTAGPQIPKFVSQTGKLLSDWVKKYLPSFVPGVPYGGELSVTQPSELEGKGLGELSSLLGQPALGDLYGSAKGHLMDTFAGKYADPEQSPFIKSMSLLAKQGLRDEIDEARGRRGARGTFFTRSGIQEESRLSERTQNYLNSLIGSFIDKERGRMLGAVPLAESLERYSLEAPLKRIGAAETFGSLPRILEQSGLERQYQEFGRQREELKGIPGVGTSILGGNYPFGINSWAAPQQQSGGSALSGIFSALGGIDWTGGGQFNAGKFGSWIDLALKVLPFLAI